MSVHNGKSHVKGSHHEWDVHPSAAPDPSQDCKEHEVWNGGPC